MKPLLVLWGVPGAGKSCYADWLVRERGFMRVDTDSMGAGSNPVEWAWRGVIDGQTTPGIFLNVVARQPQPVVVEYGVFVQPGSVGLLTALCDAGAQAWWFDGDREAARQSWRQANVGLGRDFPEDLWDNVVGVINANRHLLAALNQLCTVMPGPRHLSPETIFATMFGRPDRSD